MGLVHRGQGPAVQTVKASDIRDKRIHVVTNNQQDDKEKRYTTKEYAELHNMTFKYLTKRITRWKARNGMPKTGGQKGITYSVKEFEEALRPLKRGVPKGVERTIPGMFSTTQMAKEFGLSAVAIYKRIIKLESKGLLKRGADGKYKIFYTPEEKEIIGKYLDGRSKGKPRKEKIKTVTYWRLSVWDDNLFGYVVKAVCLAPGEAVEMKASLEALGIACIIKPHIMRNYYGSKKGPYAII